MFQLFYYVVMLFVIAVIVGNLWVSYIHPFLFGEAMEDKLDDAVEKKVMKEVDRKAAEILEEEE